MMPRPGETVQAGAKGVISVTANVAPRAMADMIAAALRGGRRRRREVGRRDRAACMRVCSWRPTPIPAKWALARMGLMGAGVRLPLTELAAQFQPDLERALRQAGVLR